MNGAVKAHEHHSLCRDLAGMDWRVGQPKRLSLMVAWRAAGPGLFGAWQRRRGDGQEPISAPGTTIGMGLRETRAAVCGRPTQPDDGRDHARGSRSTGGLLRRLTR